MHVRTEAKEIIVAGLDSPNAVLVHFFFTSNNCCTLALVFLCILPDSNETGKKKLSPPSIIMPEAKDKTPAVFASAVEGPLAGKKEEESVETCMKDLPKHGKMRRELQ